MNLKLKKGFDIHLAGKAKNELAGEITSEVYSFKPTDFKGITRPKLLVNEGDTVKVGTPIFRDKRNESVQFCAPVSGEIVEIKRGAKRFPLEVRILADKSLQYETFPTYAAAEIATLDAQKLLENLLKSGIWPKIVERPFGLVPNPAHLPKAVFISAFDTHPLAPDYEFVFQGQEAYLQAGIDALLALTKAPIHLSVPAGKLSLFASLRNVTLHQVKGPHPAGNVGVQIHHIAPINRGERIWTINPYGLQQMGYFLLEGRYEPVKTIALVGSEVSQPAYYRVREGIPVAKIVQGKLRQDHVRLVSGNVLTGTRIDLQSGILGYFDNMLTVLPEGDYHEFLGWILPSAKKLSFHRAIGLLSFLSPKKERVLDTNMHGEERAFVQTGVFEQVVPMDILPMHLLKAILSRDFEEMEALGIYEVLEEDLALCEFIDVSKTPVQAILREGLEALLEA